MPPINLSNLNISIQQFQDISSGKYNAGEITLTSDHSLGKINDHVHTRSSNVDPISHIEVLAIKDAFVKALQQNGVAADEINRVRQELGLAPVGTTDTSLASRSIRPLTRQQVRVILDRNEATLNGHNPNLEIVTYEANHIRFNDREREAIARTRNEVNAQAMRQRKLIPDLRIVDVQNVIAGNVAFADTPELRRRLIAVAESQKACILQGSNGNPSHEPNATLRYPIPETGLNLSFQLGMSEADYVRKLDDMIVLLRGQRRPSVQTLAVRNEFRAAAASGPEGAARWVASLAQDPQGAFKARTIAVGILFDHGIDDWETLSLVNRLPDFAAITFASSLVNHLAPNLRGDELRQSPLVTSLADQVEQQPVPAARQAYIPALSSDEVNENALAVLKRLQSGTPTRETANIQDIVRRGFEARFGADIFRANATFESVASPAKVSEAFAALGHPGTVRLTEDQIADAIIAKAESDVARSYLSKAIATMLQAKGATQASPIGIASSLFLRHPQIKARLLAVQSPEEARAAINAFIPEIEAGIRRQIAVDRCRAEAANPYRERIATAMGVPVASLLPRGVIDLSRLSTKGSELSAKICSGENPANTDEEIAAAFRALANVSADVRINLMRQADELDIMPEARDILKGLILTVRKPTTIPLATLKQTADEINVDDLVSTLTTAVTGGGSLDAVRQAMEKVGRRVVAAVRTVYANGDFGAEETSAGSSLILTLALAKRPGVFDLMRMFFARPEAANMSLQVQELAEIDNDDPNPRSRAELFMLFRPDQPAAESNAALADAIGRPDLAPLHAQAINLAFADLGIGDLPAEEKARLVSDGAQALADQVRAADVPVTPWQLRMMAQAQFTRNAADILARRHISTLASQNGINAQGIDDFAYEILYKRDPALRERLAGAVSRALAFGEDPSTAVTAILDAHAAAALAAVRSLDALRRVDATARETAIREIAARANLDEAFVRAHLNDSGLGLVGGSLDFLRGDIRDELANPATDVAAWDVAAVEERARQRVTSFIDKKVAFLAEVDRLPLSDARRGSLVAATLAENGFMDAELVAATNRILRRADIRAAFAYAKNTLTAEKVAQLSDQDLFFVFETVGSTLNAAIEAELSEEKRASMDRGDHGVLRALLGAALVDNCGKTLLDAAARLAADDRFAALDAAGEASRRRHDNDFMFHSTGVNSRGEMVGQPSAQKAAEANKSVAAAAFGIRLLSDVKVALDDEWLPAPLAEAVNGGSATAEQRALAAAAVKRAPGLVASLGEGLPPDKFARLKAFAITLDYRDIALAATEEVLRNAAKTIRDAQDAPEEVAQAEEKLADAKASLFSTRDAAAFVATAAQAAGVALDEAKAAKAVALLSEFGAGIPVRNARCLARFIVNLHLTEQSAEQDRARVQLMAPQLALWREFTVDAPGKEQIGDFLKDEANALILDYEKPAKKASEFKNDISSTMVRDLNRGYYTIGGKRFRMRPAAEVLEAFNKVVTTPKAKRALSILMSQASALPVLSIQMKFPSPPNDVRQQVLDPSTLAGSGEFVSRGMADPQLFMSQQIPDDITSVFDLVVSEDGNTATLKIVKTCKMLVGTTEDKMHTHFGSFVVEEELTINLAAEVPTVTNVRVSQSFDDTLDLEVRYMQATEPIPAPPPVPPAPVPGSAPVPVIPVS